MSTLRPPEKQLACCLVLSETWELFFLPVAIGGSEPRARWDKNPFCIRVSRFRSSYLVIISHTFAPVKITLLPVSAGPE